MEINHIGFFYIVPKFAVSNFARRRLYLDFVEVVFSLREVIIKRKRTGSSLTGTLARIAHTSLVKKLYFDFVEVVFSSRKVILLGFALQLYSILILA